MEFKKNKTIFIQINFFYRFFAYILPQPRCVCQNFYFTLPLLHNSTFLFTCELYLFGLLLSWLKFHKEGVECFKQKIPPSLPINELNYFIRMAINAKGQNFKLINMHAHKCQWQPQGGFNQSTHLPHSTSEWRLRRDKNRKLTKSDQQ